MKKANTEKDRVYRVKDLAGQKFGRLTALRLIGKRGPGKVPPMNDGMVGKHSEIEEAALCSLVRQYGSVAIAGLIRVMHTSKSDRLRVSAINMLLDLGYGRSPQSSDIADRDPPPLPELRDDMTLEELQAAYRQMLKMPARR